jgi:hypothetical protein
MIGNLRGTTERNQEQDWLKTNLANFTRMLQGQRDSVHRGPDAPLRTRPLMDAQQGTIYQVETEEDQRGTLRLLAALRSAAPPTPAHSGRRGPRRPMRLRNDAFCSARSGRLHAHSLQALGEANPASIVVLPVVRRPDLRPSSSWPRLHPFSVTHLTFLEQLTQSDRRGANND